MAEESQKFTVATHENATVTPPNVANADIAENIVGDEAKPRIKRARVLGGFVLDGVDYYPNDVIEAGTKIISSLGSSVDASAEAVSYALEHESAVVKKHIAKK